MDKWLKTVLEENVDDPQPISNLTNCTQDEVNDHQIQPECPESINQVKKKMKIVRNFNEKWTCKAEFKNWLTQKKDFKGNNMGYCNVCGSFLSPHLTEIKRHGLSKKHLQSIKQVAQQPSVSTVFKMSSLTEKTRIGELKMTALLAKKNLPFSLMDTLTPLLSSVFTDSQIAKNMTLKRTKSSTIMKNVLSKSLLDEICYTLKQPGCFYSLIMDESSDISEKKQCAIVVIYFNTEAMVVETKFLDIIETASGNL